MGNVTSIEDLTASPEPDRIYTYQPFQYFLASASGPWPGPLAWTYDAIGNRLTEIRGATTDTYAYTLNAATGNTPRLESVALGGGTRTYEYGDAGHVTGVTAGANEIAFGVADDGRMTTASRTGGETALLTYDGRSFLAHSTNELPRLGPALVGIEEIFADGFESGDVCAWSDSIGWDGPSCPSGPQTFVAVPRYSSDGTLHLLEHDPEPSQLVLYLAGRPVALLTIDLQPTVVYLTADHLGTPVLATDETGNAVWAGGFEPFGKDHQAGTSAGASENGVFLRFPGQWADPSWEDATLGGELYYNLHRWHETGTSRYTRPDPLGIGGFGFAPVGRLSQHSLLGIRKLSPDERPVERGVVSVYAYASNNPLGFIDPLGLEPVACGVFKILPNVPYSASEASCAMVGACVGKASGKVILTGGFLIIPSCFECPDSCTFHADSRSVWSRSSTDWYCEPWTPILGAKP
jgi:hypothetical protein